MSDVNRLFQTIVFAAIILIASVAPAMANPFTVAGIRIDATANNAADAQAIAISQGQTRAAEILIARLTLPQDLADSLLPVLDTSMASQLVAGYDIANERRSPTRYIADLTVTFDRRAIRNLLRSYDLPYVETPQPTMLVIPVLQGGSQPVVWEGPWYEIWASGRFENGLTPAVGLGQYEDNGAPLGRSYITASQAMSMDQNVLEELALLYGVDRVAVIAARQGSNSVSATGQYVDFSLSEPAYTRLPTVASGQGFEGAANRLIDELDLAWKEQSIVRNTNVSELQITVLHRNIRDWRTLQTAIAGASLISDARLDALSVQGAVMTLSYRGDVLQLANELEARGARLVEYDDLGWTVQSGR